MDPSKRLYQVIEDGWVNAKFYYAGQCIRLTDKQARYLGNVELVPDDEEPDFSDMTIGPRGMPDEDDDPPPPEKPPAALAVPDISPEQEKKKPAPKRGRRKS